MSVKVNFEAHGLKELQKALTDLPKELVSNGGGPVKTALMAGTLVIMRHAQANVPNRDDIPDTGRLGRALRRRRATKVPKGRESVQIYVRKGSSREDESGAYYAPWVEFGAKGVPGSRWLRDSMQNSSVEALEKFRTSLAGGIEKIAKKIGNENIRKVAAQIKKY